jgi:hypothetical protein
MNRFDPHRVLEVHPANGGHLEGHPMNRTLSVVVLMALPASLRSGPTIETPLGRLARRVVALWAQTTTARRLARAESAAARIALAREGIGNDPSRLRDGPPTSAIHTDYDVLRQIR